MTNEETGQIAEDEVAEEVAADEGDGFELLDPVTQVLIERQRAEAPGTEEEVAEEAEEAVEEVADEPEYLFELEDGTKVTAEEAEKGYLRRADYTKKSQANAEEKKKMERYNAIIDRMENDEKMLKMNVDYMTGGKQAQPAQQGTAPMDVPEQYKDDPLVTKLIERNNLMAQRLDAVEGTANTIQKTTTDEKQRVEHKTSIDRQLAAGYEYLKGQVGTMPTPQEYTERFQQYMTEQDLDPQVVGAYLLGGDPDYLRAKVDRIFAADIEAHKTDTVNSGEKERKKRVAKTKALHTSGKSKAAAPQALPKGANGKLDLRASLVRIQEEQEKLRQG